MSNQLARPKSQGVSSLPSPGPQHNPNTARYRVVCTAEGHWVGAPLHTATSASASSSSSSTGKGGQDSKSKGPRRISGPLRFLDDSGLPIPMDAVAPGPPSLAPGFVSLQRKNGDFASSPTGEDSEPEPEMEEFVSEHSLHPVDLDLGSLDRSPRRVAAHVDDDKNCSEKESPDMNFVTRTALLSENIPVGVSGLPAWGHLRQAANQAAFENDLEGLTGAWIPLGAPPDTSPRRIAASRVYWPDGTSSQLLKTKAGTVVMQLQQDVLRATVIDSTLVWAHGEVWTKIRAPEEAELEFREDDLGLCIVDDDDDRPPRLPPATRHSINNPFDLSDTSPCSTAIWPSQDAQEEAEWLARKRLTGTVGRLVNYREHQRPAQDIQGLRRTYNGHLVVTTLLQDGPAARAGVCAGDRLASINGRHVNTLSHLRHNILENLEGPVTLVFLGFAGKLQAEVRVRQPDQPRCGLPAATDVVDCSRLVRPAPRLPEAVIFHDAFCSSLMIATDSDIVRPVEDIWEKLESWNESVPGPTASFSSSQAPSESLLMDCTYTSTILDEFPLGLYELQRDEAKRILKRAMRTYASQPQTLCSV